MAKILSGVGGTSCQLCTATYKQIHDLEKVKEGFPINRTITNAKYIFEEVDKEEFLYRKSDERFNITHRPISDIDIVSGSPLHAYLRCFAWFLNLVSHINAGISNKWSPTSIKVLESKKFVVGLIDEKLKILIDIPSQGGTSTTGNVVRRCFKREDDSVKDFLYWILTLIPNDFKNAISDIFNYLGTIFNGF